jgi:NADH:ubiquinone oxidoreductase subunit 3 (subunit A)
MIDETVSSFGVVALAVLIATGLALLALAFSDVGRREDQLPAAWAQFRFGYPVYALIFLAFDMEMIFMYPWAVVFADLGMSAFLDMLVFIALLSAGIAYAWSMGGLAWE